MAKLAPRLAEWCRSALPPEERTVVVRPAFSADTDELARQIAKAGARVESAGAGAITVVATPRALEAVAALPGIVAVDEPRTLQTRFPKR
jgi:hypothetical protein